MNPIHDLLHDAAYGSLKAAWLPAAMYVAMIAIVFAVEQYRMCRWPGVPGRVQHTGAGSASTGGQIAVQEKAFCYEYEVGGKIYQGTRYSFWSPFLGRQRNMGEVLQPGKSVTVYYHPRHPEKSVLKCPGPRVQLMTLSTGIMPLLLLLFG